MITFHPEIINDLTNLAVVTLLIAPQLASSLSLKIGKAPTTQ